jgi:methylenetetrahydrofolate reductase (NADPH)
MRVLDLMTPGQTRLSFEFFPPRTADATQRLATVVEELKSLNPAYISITYGAGGTTRDATRELVVRFQHELGIPVVSHLTCVGSTVAELEALLQDYAEQGIANVLALRGDKPAGEDQWRPTPGGCDHASDLVALIRKSQPAMGIGVAGFPEGHPECPNRLLEMDYLKAKVDAGADYICTQLFFDNHDFEDFRERCELAGIRVPIVAGIMPLSSVKSMRRMAELAAGSRFPGKLLRALSRATSEADVRKVGTHWAAEQVRDLLDQDVPGIHFYTLNQSEQVLDVCRSLGIQNGEQAKRSDLFVI